MSDQEQLDNRSKLLLLLEEAQTTAIENITSSRRREIGLDSQIEAIENTIKYEEETIENSYRIIQANLVLIHETEGNINARRALLALLESFRDELGNGTDVTSEYEEGYVNE